MLIAPVLLAPGLAEAGRAGLPPPSELLLRSLERFERDAAALDQVVPADAVDPAAPPGSAGGDGLSPAERGLLEQLAAPAAATIPAAAAAVTIEQEARLSLPVALALALRNSPALAQEVASVQERRQWLRSVRGRFWPELWLELGGGGRQMASYNKVWQDNAGLYPAVWIPLPGGSKRLEPDPGKPAAGHRRSGAALGPGQLRAGRGPGGESPGA
ncbi:hypothetical protein [Synechococcus sp. CBW1107]|uniref:hypothetical protein n=1 Tax=Synechococcus sp. CBW1107 TaxID=2789857 RepID=UPI002AD41CE8|nr:hypothetical protein [Synechococcus sp. CBW1107]